MTIARFILDHAFYLLVSVSAIPAFLWMYEFRKELEIKHIWQYVLFLLCIYGIGIISTYGIAELENVILGKDLANRRGWSVFVTMPLFYLLVAKFTKRDIKAASDILGIQVMLIYGFGRTACVFQGCCPGKIIPGTSFRWPLVEIEIIFLAAFVFFQGAKAYGRKFDGKSYPLFLVIYGVFRLFLELFRDIEIMPSYYGLFIGCVVFIIIGVVWLIYIKKSEKANQTKEVINNEQ